MLCSAQFCDRHTNTFPPCIDSFLHVRSPVMYTRLYKSVAEMKHQRAFETPWDIIESHTYLKARTDFRTAAGCLWFSSMFSHLTQLYRCLHVSVLAISRWQPALSDMPNSPFLTVIALREFSQQKECKCSNCSVNTQCVLSMPKEQWLQFLFVIAKR